jgi:hypothetical protein
MQIREKIIRFTSTALLLAGLAAQAQMIDNTQAPNTANAGINKSLLDEIGAGRGDVMTQGSSIYIRRSQRHFHPERLQFPGAGG